MKNGQKQQSEQYYEASDGHKQKSEINPDVETECDQFGEQVSGDDEDKSPANDDFAEPFKKFNPFENLRMNLIEKVRQYEEIQ